MAAQSELSRLMRRFRALRSESMTKTLTAASTSCSPMVTHPWRNGKPKGAASPSWASYYPYFIHHYNRHGATSGPWKSLSHCRSWPGGSRSLLELGNVMSYYSDTPHTVIDRYEDSPAWRMWICRLSDRTALHCFVSISTFEHIGWTRFLASREVDEAFARVRSFMSSPHRKIPRDVPIGYNPHFDDLVATSRLVFRSRARSSALTPLTTGKKRT